jgi:ribosomal protein L7/L12
MKHILILLLALVMSFNTFGQITANKVTSIKGKLNKDKLEFKKTDAKIWVFIHTENNGNVTRIELNETKANASSLTLEQKELGVKIVIDVANLSAIGYSLNEAKQYVESTETTITIESADDSETVPINEDQIDS